MYQNHSISPHSSPVPPITLSSPSSPTPPDSSSSHHAATHFLPSSSSRSSSPLMPTVGPSPTPSSPTFGCYSPSSPSGSPYHTPLTSPYPTPTNTPRTSICGTTTDSGHSEMSMDQDLSPSSISGGPGGGDAATESPSMQEHGSGEGEVVEIPLAAPPHGRPKSVQEVLVCVRAALDTLCPHVDYQCYHNTWFRLNRGAEGGTGQSDLSMELQVCSHTDGHVPRLAVRKLSGDNLECAKLCNHLMAHVNS